MWCYVATPHNKTALPVWLMKRKHLGFVCHSNRPLFPISHSLWRNPPNWGMWCWSPEYPTRRCSFIWVQRSVSCSVKEGLLIRTFWSSLQAVRSWQFGAPQKRCMWCWPLHEKEFKQHTEECPYISAAGRCPHTRQESKLQPNEVRKMNDSFKVSADAKTLSIVWLQWINSTFPFVKTNFSANLQFPLSPLI